MATLSAKLIEGEIRDAHFSKDGKKRYSLLRQWDETKPLALFICLNPSNGSIEKDSPTIRKLRSISKANGFGGFYIGNLYPNITPIPAALEYRYVDIMENREELFRLADKITGPVVLAYGTTDQARSVTDSSYLRSLKEKFKKLHCISCSAEGVPHHPLSRMVPGDKKISLIFVPL